MNTSVSVIDPNNTSGRKITASAAYIENGNFMASQTDTMGNVTTYDYNYKENDDDDGDNGDRSLLRSVTVGTEENPSITSYTYDAMNRTKAVENGDSKVSYVYDDDYLTTITHRNTYNAATDTGLNTIYQFDYGNFGLLNKVIVGDDDESTANIVEETALITHEYNTKDQGFTLAKSTYGNGHSVAYAYDDQFRTKSITYNGASTPAVEYEYDNNGNLGVLKDHLGNRTVKYLYDAADRLMKVQSQYLTVGWEYDDLNNLTQQKYTVDESYFTYNLRGKADVVTSYTYDKDNRTKKITSQVTDKNNTYNAGLVSANYSYDGYGRNGSTEYWHGEDKLLTRSVEFVTTDDFTTSVVSKLTNATDFYNVAYQYEYDAQGNITGITCGNKTITYEYDKLNQLVRENNPITGETWVYTYDLGGNITSKTKYDYTTAANPTNGEEPIVYVYGDPNWPDRLTKYNNKDIDSDSIGNMKYDGTWTYTWQNGRQLAGMSKSGTSISYTYDSDGMRTSKTVNGTTTKYMYYGGQLVAMDTEFGPVYFHYDSTGIMAMEVQGTMLYYVKNAQGDIVALVDTNGYPVVEYTYDAWGNLLGISGLYATTYGVYNPFTYRGYVYDHETGLYYLQSRYYSPYMSRFICGDAFASTGQGPLSYNMFSYCDNNPINFEDINGTKKRAVGAGIQIELDIGDSTVGLEVIVYWDNNVCGDDELIVALYGYNGVSIDLSDPLMQSLLNDIQSNVHLLAGGTESGINTMISLIQEGFSASVCGVLIIGNESFKSVESYAGPFTSISGNIKYLKGGFAYSDTCISFVLGATVGSCTNTIGSASVSFTNYTLLDIKTIPLNRNNNIATNRNSNNNPLWRGGSPWGRNARLL